MSRKRSILCDRCASFDVRALLIATESSSRASNTDNRGWPLSPKSGLVYQGQDRFFEHHPSLVSLRSSSERCDLCRAIWSQFCRDRKEHELSDEALRDGIGSRPIYLGTLPWDTGLNAIPHVVALQHGLPPHNARRQLACFEPCAAAADSTLDNRHLLGRLQSSSSLDEECFTLARHWLKQCREEHPDCDQKRGITLRFPTRVLDISPDDTEPDLNLVRLVSGFGHDEPYVALSYCWGGPQALILTNDTEARLQGGIEATCFPPTIRDAVIVTRKLGLRYLWVDALCILQDSDDDKGREIARMRDVYRGAVITLEAASALKAGDGFLKERTSSMPYCGLPWGLQDNSPDVYLRPLFDISDNQLLASKLYTRGWTLQERLLAPRTLSFGSQQISFECCRGFLDESGRSSTLPRVTEAYLSKKTMHELRGEQQMLPWLRRYIIRLLHIPATFELFNIKWYTGNIVSVPGGYVATYYDYWRSVVERFGERELTEAGDRLPAVAGLAKEIQTGTEDSYIAGHWRSELIRSLNWRCVDLYNYEGEYGPGKHQSPISPNQYVYDWPDGIKAHKYIAPSWSWASCKGRVVFWDYTYQRDVNITEIAKLVDYKTETQFDDPFGAVLSAYIDISAPVLTIPDPQAQCDPTYPLIALHQEVQSLARRNEHTAAEFHQHHEPHPDQEFALLQLELDNGDGHTNKDARLFMLLLESCGDGTYRRLSIQSMPWTNIAEQLQDRLSPGDDDYNAYLSTNYQRMIDSAEAVASAPWKQRTVRVV